MAKKCTNKGCGKTFEDPEESCIYHSGTPVFHEGQKGWKCCKPRVLTFDEFLAIPPCTTGKHSTEDTTTNVADLGTGTTNTSGGASMVKVDGESGKETYGNSDNDKRIRMPTAAAKAEKKVEVEKIIEEDEPGVTVTSNTKCKRSSCDVVYEGEQTRQSKCVHHPGSALFHEGSKGWTCCKRRVLEFDEFLKIPGCTEGNHMFVGPKRDAQNEELVTCRTDFYQTYTHLNVSIFQKKILKDKAIINFKSEEIDVDLPTADHKRYKATIPLYAKIVPVESTFKIMGTKAELTLRKADGTSWPTLRNDEESGDIIQVGRAAMA